MNTQVENKLIEITNSLSKLDSARKQVEDVTTSSQALLNETTQLTKLYKELYDVITYESNGFSDVLAENRNKLESSLSKMVAEWNGKEGEIINEFEAKGTFLKNEMYRISENQKLLNKKYSKEQQKSIKEFTDNLNKLETSLEQLRTYVDNYSFDNLGKSLNELHQLIELANGKLIKAIEESRKISTRNSIVTWVLLGIIGIVLLVLIFRT